MFELLLIFLFVGFSVFAIVSNRNLVNNSLDKAYYQLKGLEYCKRNKGSINGTINGYKFEVSVSYDAGDVGGSYPDNLSIALHGKFPKQKTFMLTYPKLGDGISWQGDALYSSIEFHEIDGVHDLMRKMAEKAVKLENTTV